MGAHLARPPARRPAAHRGDSRRGDRPGARRPARHGARAAADRGCRCADLHVIPLWDETPVVVAAKDHPVKVFDTVTLADIADEELYPGWDDATLDIVAAGHGIARMPQAVLRATGRRDVVGRPITDAEPSRVGLVWRRTTEGPLIDEFIGIVRGRTANSSRGSAETPPPEPKPKRVPKDAKPKPKRARHQRKPRQTR